MTFAYGMRFLVKMQLLMGSEVQIAALIYISSIP